MLLKMAKVFRFGPLTTRKILRCWRLYRERTMKSGALRTVGGAGGVEFEEKRGPYNFLQPPERRLKSGRCWSLLPGN